MAEAILLPLLEHCDFLIVHGQQDLRTGQDRMKRVVAGGHCSLVARALAAKARCPGFDSWWCHFLCSPKSFQRSMDSNDANRDLFQ